MRDSSVPLIGIFRVGHAIPNMPEDYADELSDGDDNDQHHQQGKEPFFQRVNRANVAKIPLGSIWGELHFKRLDAGWPRKCPRT
jgi:hypothetical protein